MNVSPDSNVNKAIQMTHCLMTYHPIVLFISIELAAINAPVEHRVAVVAILILAD